MAILKFFLCATVSLIAANVMAGPGALDTTYAPGINNGPVFAAAFQPNGSLVIGGGFTTVGGGAAGGGSSRSHIARLFANGSLDTSFLNNLAGVSSTVYCLAVQTDGRIVIGGTFNSVNGTVRYGVARLNSNGAVDGSFIPTNYFNVNALAVQTNNAVIIGGGSQTGYVVRLNADGSFDNVFTNYANGIISAVAIQTDGKVVLGGSFGTVGGLTRNYLARLNTDGSLDTTFLNGLTGPSSTVRTVLIQPDGKILIGGDFTSVNGTGRGHFARLTSTGALDTGFNSLQGVNGSVYALALQSDSSVLVAGTFSVSSAGGSDLNLARFYPDGTTDTNFFSTFNSVVYSLAVQSDGGIIAGGLFTTVSNVSQPYLARVYGNLYPPQFILQPTNKNVPVGSNVTFTALVSNPTLTYFQWRKNGNDIAGATDVAYSLNNVQLGDAGTYTVFANNTLGGVTSSNAVLQVGVAPTITQQPVSLTVTQGQAATFTIGASGTPLSYFWKKNGTFIPGATNPSLTFASVVFTNAATYTCQISNFLGNITSAGAVLTVYAPPVILVQPTNLTVGVSSNFTVAVLVNGTSPLYYQWFKDSNPLASTNASVTITNSQTTDSGGYSVVITNSFGSVTSSIANVSVTNFPPTITSQPVGGTFLVGSNFTLSVTAVGPAPFGYQWNTTGVPISGANATNYSVINAQTNDSGAYTVVITNSGGSVTSIVAQVNVGYAPVILQQPLPFTNNIGSSNSFNVLVSGSDPMLYQWFKDGVAIPNATNGQLILPSLQTNQIGYYSAMVTNIYGWAASSNALLSISNVALPFQWVGLVAYYPFSGDTSDASGNGNNGTNNGAVLTSDRFGSVNSAYSFNGNGQFISVANAPSLNTGSQLTLAVWVNFDLGGTFGPRIISKATQNGIEGYELATDGLSSQRQIGYSIGASAYQLDSVQSLNAGQWAYITATYDGNLMSIYVNGLLDSSTSASGMISNSADLAIGHNSVSGSDVFAGRIDEVRIYNRALSSNEVAQLYTFESDLPVIINQPQSQVVMQGGIATFSVNATAAHPLTYQWFKDGTALNYCTNTSLVITNVQSALAGSYTVAISNVLVGVASSPAVLTIVAPITNSTPAYASNQFGFNISGLAGSNFVVEFSTNLQTWVPLATNTFGTNVFQFVDPSSTTNPLRFYRTRY